MDDLNKLNDRIFNHETRISTNETNIKSITSDVKDLESGNRKVVWIIVAFVISGILTAVFKGNLQ